MAKVTMPLGSELASGHVGQQLIFQGTTVKAFRKPRNPKTAAQVATRDKFQSITKTILEMKPWARGCMQGMLGIGWYGLLYREILARWTEAEILYNGFVEGIPELWSQYAPYTGTRINKGLVFYACYYAINTFSLENGVNFFTYFTLDGEPSTARYWWDKEITDVFYPGKYDDNNASLQYGPTSEYWNDVIDSNAYGGSFVLSQTSTMASLEIFFFGTKLGILYHQSLAYSAASVTVDNGAELVFSQNNIAGLYQVEFQTPVYNRGLHAVHLWRSGAVGAINIDGIVVYG